MREIKFRAWFEGEMLSPDDLVDMDQNTHAVYTMLAESCRTNEAVFMQYTGFKDKNGREIYEGDIIRIYNDEIDEEDSWIGEVSYHMGGFFSWDEDLLGNVHFRAKVIGNIYENPELLEGSE